MNSSSFYSFPLPAFFPNNCLVFVLCLSQSSCLILISVSCLAVFMCLQGMRITSQPASKDCSSWKATHSALQLASSCWFRFLSPLPFFGSQTASEHTLADKGEPFPGILPNPLWEQANAEYVLLCRSIRGEIAFVSWGMSRLRPRCSSCNSWNTSPSIANLFTVRPIVLALQCFQQCVPLCGLLRLWIFKNWLELANLMLKSEFPT